MSQEDFGERVAVLESLSIQREKDTTALFQLIRDHMDREEVDRKIIISAIEELRLTQQKQKSFVGGIIFIVSSLWAIALAGILLLKTKVGGL